MSVSIRDCMDIAATAAAIGTEMGASRRWMRAYEAVQDNENGITGIWESIADAAQALHLLSKKEDIAWGVTHDWILTVEALGKNLIDHMIRTGSMPHGETLDLVLTGSLVRE